MLTLQELCLYLNELLQPSGFSDYCKNGLQVEGKSTITTIATAVSASFETIEKAVELNVDALIVHHGMFWNTDSHEVVGVKKKKLQQLLNHDISLIAYHLPLDAHREFGNNWKAAQDMGWIDIKPFGYSGGTPIGVMGIIPDLTAKSLQARLEAYYSNKSHVALFGKDNVKTAGLVSGGAFKYIEEAVRENLDCFITGNFDEPVWNMAMENEINFYALGHSATEKVGPKALRDHLEAKFHLSCTFIDVNNPF
jgi:dinuclear metal center YbgI/SA1388 family protein